jgi:hypothetical protein
MPAALAYRPLLGLTTAVTQFSVPGSRQPGTVIAVLAANIWLEAPIAMTSIEKTQYRKMFVVATPRYID